MIVFFAANKGCPNFQTDAMGVFLPSAGFNNR
jgi:hypothetical protein